MVPAQETHFQENLNLLYFLFLFLFFIATVRNLAGPVIYSASCRSSQEVCGLCGSVPGLQSSADVLPEDSFVLAGLRPAQVGASLHQLPHAVVRRQLLGRDLLQKQQDQNVLVLVKQAEAAATQTGQTVRTESV